MSPAVITETLFGLWEKQGVMGGEIHILTTSYGQKSMQVLLGKGGQVAAFNNLYATNWAIYPEWIEALTGPLHSQPLTDLRTSADNECAANGIVERVREWTQQSDIVLHASVAGGRKTMGLYLTQAMSWFARPEDDLSHVLVPDVFEKERDFYFPNKTNPSHQGIVDFATIPFVRMYGLLPPLLQKEQSYSERVKLSQAYLADISSQTGRLSLDLVQHTLFINHYQLINFQPLSIGLYLFLLEYANLAKGQSPFYFKRAFDYRDKLVESLTRTGSTQSESGLSSLVGLPEEEWLKYWKISGQRDQIEARKNDLENAFGKLHKDLKEIWVHASFQVFKGKRNEAKGPCRWVDIVPDRIQLIERKVLLIQ